MRDNQVKTFLDRFGCATSGAISFGLPNETVSLASILETESDYLARHPGATHSDWLAYVRKYLLSPTAARGILRRAERRKKTLPPHLQEALQLVAGSMPPDDEGKMT